MEELTSSNAKRPLKTRNNDVAVLRQLAAELNDPRQTGAVLTKEQAAENEAILATEMAKAQSVENIPVSAQIAASAVVNAPPAAPSAPATPIEVPKMLFITGQPGSGIESILSKAAGKLEIINLHELSLGCLKATAKLKGNPPLASVTEFRKFGDGEFLPSMQNILLLGLLRTNDPDFGTPGFWARRAVIVEAAKPERQTVFVGLRTSTEFKTLQEHGVKHYHAMCTPATMNQRRPATFIDSQLSHALDADVHKNISARKDGPRLNVIWTDVAAPPSSRFISEKEFVEVVFGFAQSVVESEMQSQII